MENNSKFVKIGDTVSFKPKTDGIDYNLEAGAVYTIEVDRWTDAITLKTAPAFNMPEKVYETVGDSVFITRVLNNFNTSEKGMTGVMLSGLKGSGKTIMAKNIANKSGLPIILIDKGFRPSLFTKLFNMLADTPVCFVFDEVDKLGENYDDDYLLKVLDGANSSGKHIILCTCNNSNDISEYLKDRCSRIRYWKTFDSLPTSMIQSILEDRLDDKDEVKPLTDFIVSEFAVTSFDNICAFVDEVNAYQKMSFEDLFKDMNLSSK